MGLKFEICTPYGSIEILYFSKAIQFIPQIRTSVQGDYYYVMLLLLVEEPYGA